MNAVKRRSWPEIKTVVSQSLGVAVSRSSTGRTTVTFTDRELWLRENGHQSSSPREYQPFFGKEWNRHK